MGMSQKHKRVFQELNDLAKPGDILFMTSFSNPTEFSLGRRLKRTVVGYHPNDFSNWHTALYLGPTESGNAEIAEAVISGVKVGHLPSTYYTNGRNLELGRFVHTYLDDEVRENIVAVARKQAGKSFDKLGIKGIPLQRLLGLPNLLSSADKFTCQGLSLFAYEMAGVAIPSLARDGAVDHDLYRSPFLRPLLRVEEKTDGTFKTTTNPEKYSWQPELKEIYGVYHD